MINISRENQRILNVDNEINQNNNVNFSIETSPEINEGMQFIINDDAKKSFEQQQQQQQQTQQQFFHSEQQNYDNSYGNDYGNGYQDNRDSISQVESEISGGSVAESSKSVKLSYEEIEQLKAKYLSRLRRLSLNPELCCRKLNSSHSLEEIKMEVLRAEKDRDTLAGIKYYRTGLGFLVTGMAYGNKTFLNNDELDGWPEEFHNSLESHEYDSVLEELYDKYGMSAISSPEIRLLMMVGASGVSYVINKKRTEYEQRNKYKGKMTGPSEDTDEFLRKMAEADEISSVSSAADSVISSPKKKRGRPRKNN